MLNFIEGGVCAAQGFRAAGIHVGVKTHAAWKKDVALIVSDVECAAAAVFTKNAVKAAPIHVDKAHLANGQCPGHHRQQRQRQRLRPPGGGERRADVRGGGQGHRLRAGGRAGVLHRRDWPDT